MREGRIYKNIPNPASRTGTAWRELEPALKTMKTTPRTWKRGRDADGIPERGRLARDSSLEKYMNSSSIYTCILWSHGSRWTAIQDKEFKQTFSLGFLVDFPTGLGYL